MSELTENIWACREAIRPGVLALASQWRRPQDAEDLLSEGLAWAAERAGQYDPEQGELEGWVRAVALNRCRDLLARAWAERRRRIELGWEVCRG